ncbi:hypothetical protein AADZ86_13885 [Colwelliaceae bacterium BS250]
MNKDHNRNEAINSADSTNTECTHAESNVASQEPQDIKLQTLREPEELENSGSYVLGYN